MIQTMVFALLSIAPFELAAPRPRRLNVSPAAARGRRVEPQA